MSKIRLYLSIAQIALVTAVLLVACKVGPTDRAPAQ